MQSEYTVDDDDDQREELSESEARRRSLIVKIRRPMVHVVEPSLPTRRSTRHRNSSGSIQQRSGSEFSAANASGSVSGGSENSGRLTNGIARRRSARTKKLSVDNEELVQDPEPPALYRTRSGRTTKAKSYNESSDKEMDLFNQSDDNVDVVPRRGRSGKQQVIDSDEEVMGVPTRYETRSRSRKVNGDNHEDEEDPQPEAASTRRGRLQRRLRGKQQEDDGYVDDPDADADGSTDPEEMDFDAPDTSPSPEPEVGAEHDGEGGPKQYSFRRRTKQINYAIPPPLEEVRPTKGPTRPKGKGRAGPGWSANGTELGRYMGLAGDDSDSDYTRTPRKAFGAGAGGGIFAAGGGGLFPNDLAAAGTPSNLGKVSDSALADADPLGVNTNVTFDEVGGLDDHINSLKEMTLLPLLYPEVFQRFNLTPPRGVLFHGPPGTGKTLLARALAASCRSNGKGISFFMRKGADCLSKWVGEAERQLRLLFEEARNSQPSIIFFDEIDGLAPVRSSKQDQIHASIVSTLLALMDGMDGRGQVIVIGATNRPDAIDPALRRPGRFDREFYFPLPNLAGRTKILSIITRKWEDWQTEKAEETLQGLAKITKGYGGADLRALCTEAALNAVQRRYPQIYKSNDRLLLKPETIHVQARDFMISVKKMVPSSARSTSSTASPLPPHLVPLLERAFEKTKVVIDKALPLIKKRSALEEAEWEDDGDEGALEREIMMQSMETLRVYRPRVVLHGSSGSGQGYVGAAALHHLEGFHVQSLDLGNLMGDPTRTPEAAIIQQFVEAKRHQPSVIYIPSLTAWCAAVSETARTTVRAMLDSLSPNEPVLLLAIVHDSFASLPRDVRSWFGVIRENRIALVQPAPEQRKHFFGELLNDVQRPPREFPDGVKRKKRILEELPIAPPLEPRQPTAAELALQEENDQRVIALLKYRLGPILSELKRKFKRFTKRAMDEYNFNTEEQADPFLVAPTAPPVVIQIEPQQNGVVDVPIPVPQPEPLTNGEVQAVLMERQPPPLYDIDLERIHVDLYKGKYLTPHEFLDDIGKIVHNAEVRDYEDRERLFRAQAMYTAAEVSILEFDPQLRHECERMAGREHERRKQRKEARNKSKGRDQANGAQINGMHPDGLRRSARTNGLEPELRITDPVLLERRLKRTRSNDAGLDSNGSGEEGAGDRTAKRPRGDAYDDPLDNDELDLVGPNSSQSRRTVVHFADIPEGVQSPSPHKVTVTETVAERITETTISEIVPDSEPPFPMISTSYDGQFLNPLPSLSRLRSRSPTPLAPIAELPPMPSLLSAFNGINQDSLIDRTGLSLPDDPMSIVTSQQPQFVLNSARRSAEPSAEPPDHPMNGEDDVSQRQLSVQPSMDVDQERPPSPPPSPPPVFHVDGILLAKLTQKLTNDTGALTVEQLEQLRATCLGCVWRHRQSWDRDEMAQELMEIVNEFVEEVDMDLRNEDEN